MGIFIVVILATKTTANRCLDVIVIMCGWPGIRLSVTFNRSRKFFDVWWAVSFPQLATAMASNGHNWQWAQLALGIASNRHRKQWAWLAMNTSGDGWQWTQWAMGRPGRAIADSSHSWQQTQLTKGTGDNGYSLQWTEQTMDIVRLVTVRNGHSWQ